MRILIIETHDVLRESMGFYFKRAGHTVVACENEESYSPTDETTIDLVIAEKEGISFARELRARGRHTPVIIITNDFEKAVEENHDGAARRILAKPCSPKTLIETAAGLGIQL